LPTDKERSLWRQAMFDLRAIIVIGIGLIRKMVVVVVVPSTRLLRASHCSIMMYQTQTRFRDHSPNDQLFPEETSVVH